jgi:hypothetical protein
VPLAAIARIAALSFLAQIHDFFAVLAGEHQSLEYWQSSVSELGPRIYGSLSVKS